ncbi:MAG: bifunctional hydroxymethylpyrimidine kinase/phosphomethylpyrimidine kinase [Nitrospirae bacterium]|nr:bifunctional hydroxymethylpyrimidine kinase/phosphomethylpyrimidine kinase [Nitrospirota bacterium]
MIFLSIFFCISQNSEEIGLDIIGRVAYYRALMKIKRVLTIAGSDPTAGAGLQADLRVFASLNIYGMAVPTAITIQNTKGVKGIIPLPAGAVRNQLKTLFDDVKIDAVKTGMLLTKENVLAVEEAIKRHRIKKFIIDPIIRSGTGVKLLKDDAVSALKKRLFPLAMIITPNINEAEMLTGIKIKDEKDVRLAAKAIYKMGPKYVLIKGGHLKGEANDFLFDGKKLIVFKGKRAEGIKLHGAGCVFSAAITAYLSKGLLVAEAVGEAKRFINKAIKRAVAIGRGRKVLYKMP